VEDFSDGWPVVARTKIIDDVISEAIGQGCDVKTDGARSWYNRQS
jgi:hypothetical protein